MKTSEQMTIDVLKRRDEALKAKPKTTLRRVMKIGVPCAAGLALVIAGVGTIKVIQNRDLSAGDENYIFQAFRTHTNSSAYEGEGEAAGSYYVNPYVTGGETGSYGGGTYSGADIAAEPSAPELDFTNPKSGQNDIHVLTVDKFNPDTGVIGDPNDLDEYSTEMLYSCYGLEFDRLSKLHSDWYIQHGPLGIYKKYSSDKDSVSMSMYCTRNTLNYITENGAKISVSVQYGKFTPLSTEEFACDKPFKSSYTPKVEIVYDENGNEIGASISGYNPDDDPTPRPTNDEGLSTVNGYDAYIYTDSSGNFAADIIMKSRVRITAEGVSEPEFLEILDEYTK